MAMPEPISPLPTGHVFVLRLQESRARRERSRAGRVEHLATGKAARFTTKIPSSSRARRDRAAPSDYFANWSITFRIGRNSATTMKPTTPARTSSRIGSSNLNRVPT